MQNHEESLQRTHFNDPVGVRQKVAGVELHTRLVAVHLNHAAGNRVDRPDKYLRLQMAVL